MKRKRRRLRRRWPLRRRPLLTRELLVRQLRAVLRPWRLAPRTRRRIAVAVVVLVMLCLPVPGQASGGAEPPAPCHGCLASPASAERWAARLPGTWTAGPAAAGPAGAAGGTEPAVGQAYVALGGGLAVLGDGLTVTGYAATNGIRRWQVVLAAPAGTVIVSVRAWSGVVTVGLLAPDGRSRTELVIDSADGAELRRYPAAGWGGAVAASTASTVIVGPAGVTGYDNATGRVRWRRATTVSQSWQTSGGSLYVAEYAGGSVGSSRVTALKVINLKTGAQRVLGSPFGHPFSGSLAVAEDGAVLFSSASGVTAYDGSTGNALWWWPETIAEGTDPGAHLIYLGPGDGTLTGVNPRTGKVRTTVPGTAAGSASVYVIRDGVAFALAGGANGQALGYDVARGQTTWTSDQLPWPHFFGDPSGLGGSADPAGRLIAVAACPHLAASPGLCATPELVAFALLLPGRQGKWGL
jgi:hypothetical protein